MVGEPTARDVRAYADKIRRRARSRGWRDVWRRADEYASFGTRRSIHVDTMVLVAYGHSAESRGNQAARSASLWSLGEDDVARLAAAAGLVVDQDVPYEWALAYCDR